MSNMFMMLLGVLVVLVVIIAAVLLVVLMVRNSRKSDGAAAPVEEKSRYTPVARLWRDPANNQLLVEQDGRILSSANSLNDTQRSLLKSAGQDLLAWAGGTLASSGPQISSTRAEPPPKAFDREQFFVPEPPAPVITPPPAAPTAGTPIAPPKSIVGQIDEVLQEMLAGSNLSNSAIRLVEEPRHGVIVWVGLKRYEGIDAVPDEAVRAMIRAAVKEWERRSADSSKA